MDSTESCNNTDGGVYEGVVWMGKEKLWTESYPPQFTEKYLANMTCLFDSLKSLIDGRYPNGPLVWSVPEQNGIYCPEEKVREDGSRKWHIVSGYSKDCAWPEFRDLLVKPDPINAQDDYYAAEESLYDLDNKRQVIYLGCIKRIYEDDYDIDPYFLPLVRVVVEKGSYGPQISFMFFDVDVFRGHFDWDGPTCPHCLREE